MQKFKAGAILSCKN